MDINTYAAIQPQDRVDGKDKVTGSARYAADHDLPGMTYAVIVGSVIAKGRVTDIQTREAAAAPGVLAVITHQNVEKPPAFTEAEGKNANSFWEGLRVFNDERIFFNGQPIAIVVADTLERAKYAATLVKAKYERENHHTDFMKEIENAAAPKSSWSPAEYSRGEKDAYKK